MVSRSTVPENFASFALVNLLEENVSLGVMEIVTYLLFFILLMHAHSSGKRNFTMLLASALHVALLDRVVYASLRWHAQSLVMLWNQRLPLFHVMSHAMFYYICFVSVTRLRIARKAQSFAMGVLLVLLTFPFELVGTKHLWWTFHDTHPLLHHRLHGVPYHVLFHHLCFGGGLVTAHHLLQQYWLRDFTYNACHWKREWSYVLAMPIVSFAVGFCYVVVTQDFLVILVRMHSEAAFLVVFGVSLLVFWMADRERESTAVELVLAPASAYDSDWLYPFYDHALNQFLFLFLLFLFVLLLLVEPSAIVSSGHHQQLGSCLERHEIWDVFSAMGILHQQQDFKFLCADAFDEDFTLCDFPSDKLFCEDTWYTICGRSHMEYSDYVVVLISSIVLVNLLFYQILKRPLLLLARGPELHKLHGESDKSRQ